MLLCFISPSFHSPIKDLLIHLLPRLAARNAPPDITAVAQADVAS
jgi:hypothetical protein